MNSTIQNVIFLLLVAATACLHAVSASAASVAYISSTGIDGNPCTGAQPCASFDGAAQGLLGPGQINCLDAAAINETGIGLGNSPLTIDCVGVYMVTFPGFGAFVMSGIGQSMKIRNLTINGSLGGYPAVKVNFSGTLILENCVFEDIGTGPALDIEPSGPFNLVIVNSRISGSGSGVLLKPTAAGSINATLDHVTITQNAGGGVKIDTSNGPVTTDITDSVISNNGGNGINAIGNAGGQAIVSVKSSVIARNGGAGVQANGVNAGVLIAMTLFDQNAAGATTFVNGGNMFTYGNNQIVGSAGSGFNHTAGLQ
jgi:hypothetical protein